MFLSLLLALASVVVTVTFHISVLLCLARWLRESRRHLVVRINVAFLLVCVAHALEILVFAVVIAVACDRLQVGTLEGPQQVAFHDYVYFAFETYSTVGYGNVTLSGPAEILAAVSALAGIVLTASSASLMLMVLPFVAGVPDRSSGADESPAP